MSGWGQAHINNTIGFGGGVSCGGFTGLLDEYSGAAAAYSLRQLSSSYTGSAIRVRRSSDNAEQDIGFVSNELDTTSLLSFVGANDGVVTTWYDQSGNGNDATQGSAAAQPKIVSAGVLVTENGEPALDFDGNDDFLEELTLAISQPISITSVHLMRNVTGFTGDLNVLLSSKLTTFRIRGRNTASYAITAGTESLFQTTPESTQSLTFTLFSGSSSFNALDGSPSSTSNIGTNGISGGIEIGAQTNIGAAYKFDGKIQEAIIYPTDQSTNRSGIEANINNFYSIY